MRRARRTSPPTTPPMIGPVGFPGEELDSDELPEGAPIDVGVFDGTPVKEG
jgi:hypothetical protein